MSPKNFSMVSVQLTQGTDNSENPPKNSTTIHRSTSKSTVSNPRFRKYRENTWENLNKSEISGEDQRKTCSSQSILGRRKTPQ